MAEGTLGYFKGMPGDVRNDGPARLSMGTQDHEECDAETVNENLNAAGVAFNAAGTKYLPSMRNCREVYADVAGICKYDYISSDTGEIKTEVQNITNAPWPHRCVVGVYKNYADGSACTATILKSDGSSKIGLKIRR
jgi:hypothetical protein